jgi:hypothetical protein
MPVLPVVERKGHTRMPKRTRVVIGGFDTHVGTHHAAVLDEQDGCSSTASSQRRAVAIGSY